MSKIAYQIQKGGCGVSAIKTLGYLLSHRKEYLFLPEPDCASAPSLAKLMAYAEKYGIALRAFREQGAFAFSEEAYPFIALIKKDAGLHAVVVKSLSAWGYHILDPDKGEYFLGRRSFARIYTGIHLVCFGFLPIKFKTSKRRFPILGVLSFLLAILPTIGLLLGRSYSFPMGLTFLLSFGSYVGFAQAAAMARLSSFKTLTKAEPLHEPQEFLEKAEAYKRYHLFLPHAIALIASSFGAIIFFFGDDTVAVLILTLSLGFAYLLAVNCPIPGQKRLKEAEARFLKKELAYQSLCHHQSLFGFAYLGYKAFLLLLAFMPICLYFFVKGSLSDVMMKLGFLLGEALLCLHSCESWVSKEREAKRNEIALFTPIEAHK